MNDTSNPNNNAKPLSPFLKDENYKPTPQFSGMPNAHTASAPAAPVNFSQKPAQATPSTNSAVSPTTSAGAASTFKASPSPIVVSTPTNVSTPVTAPAPATPHIESSVKPFIPQPIPKPNNVAAESGMSAMSSAPVTPVFKPTPVSPSFTPAPAVTPAVTNQPYVNPNGKSALSESQFSVAIKEAAKKAESQPYTSQFVKPPVKTSSGSSKGILSLIIFIVVIGLLAAALWFFKPVNLSDITKSIQNTFSGIFSSKSAGTIEDKLSDTNSGQSGDSLPNSVFDSQSKPNTKTVKSTKSDPFANPTTSNTDSASTQNKITAYLKKNINKIAKTTGYVVTSVEFDGPSRAVVSYEKGSSYKSAIVTTSIGPAGGVKITSFTPLTK